MEGVIQVLGFLRPESRTLDELIAVSDQEVHCGSGFALSAAELISKGSEVACAGFSGLPAIAVGP